MASMRELQRLIGCMPQVLCATEVNGYDRISTRPLDTRRRYRVLATRGE